MGGPHEADDGPLVGVLGLAVDDGQLVLVVHLLLVRAWARVSQCRVAASRVTCHVSRVQIWAADNPCKLRDACHSLTASCTGEGVESENCVQKSSTAQGREEKQAAMFGDHENIQKCKIQSESKIVD